MKYTKSGSQTRRGPEAWFTGSVYIDGIRNPDDQSAIGCAHVRFTPGRAPRGTPTPRAKRSTSPMASDSWRPATASHEIRPGDVVYIEPGEEHWHGATPARFMAHVAMQEADDQGEVVTWLDHVTDEDYQRRSGEDLMIVQPRPSSPRAAGQANDPPNPSDQPCGTGCRHSRQQHRPTRDGHVRTGLPGGRARPLVNEFIALARPGRVFPDPVTKMPLPENRSSVNLPKVLTGTTAAIQSTQNTTLSQTDLTTATVSAGITTVGGKQVVSQQLLDQSGTPVDRLVLSDLAADYARQLGSQYITGAGTSGQLRGALNGSGAVTVAYTTASPKVVDGTTPANSFLNAVVRAKVAVATTRYMPATAVVMHPRRWGRVQEALDGNGRPLITPEDANGDLNQPGRDGANVASGQVGTLANLPVYVDPEPSHQPRRRHRGPGVRHPRGRPVLLRVPAADGDLP